MNDMYTLTFGEQAENHVGMEILGDGLSARGYGVYELELLCEVYDGEMYDLGEGAKVLVIRNGVEKLGVSVGSLYDELGVLDWDKKAYMYGRVVNKKARWNLIFGEEGRGPDYENKKGRVVGFGEVPFLKSLHGKVCEMMGEMDLKVEGNYYYDLKNCGIGFHGDSERRKVVGVRLGGSQPIVYQWYLEGEEVGAPISIPLNGGDVYVMSEKATGTDWKLKKIKTLRHAVGAKFVVNKKRGVKRKCC